VATQDVEFQNQAPQFQVLLAEDNIVNQEVTRSQLKLMGCSVQIANNGEEAIKAIQQQNFDLILMDCHMPIMDGYAATRQIREIEQQAEKAQVPIIALTADVAILNQDLCIKSGMNDYMTKPIAIKELKKTLRVWLKKKVARLEKQTFPAPLTPSQLDGEESPIDITILNELRQCLKNNDTNRIIKLYLQELPNSLSSLEKSIKSKNGKALREIAHKFKGASTALGAQRVIASCIVLEEFGREGVLEKAKPEFLKLKAECELLKPVLEEQINIYIN